MRYQTKTDDELREEYDFSQMTDGVRGKYAKYYHEDVRIIMLDPDAKSVNEALRALAKIIQQHHNQGSMC